MYRSWDQRYAESALATYPYRLEVRGAPRSLTWPDVCVNCGGGATERVRVRRAFYWRARRRQSRGWFGYQVVSADLPLCSACAARHRETVPQVSWFRRYRWWVLNPAHIATIGCAVLLAKVTPVALHQPTSTGLMAAWGLAGIFIFGMIWTIGITWWMSRPDRFEPLSEITSACSISGDVSLFFERRRHMYGFRNRTFAEAFERANEARVWTDRDQARMSTRSVIAMIVFLAVLGVARLLLWYYQGR